MTIKEGNWAQNLWVYYSILCYHFPLQIENHFEVIYVKRKSKELKSSTYRDIFMNMCKVWSERRRQHHFLVASNNIRVTQVMAHTESQTYVGSVSE